MRTLFAIAMLLAMTSEAHASWGRLKAYIKPDAQVVRETNDELVIEAPGLERRIVIRGDRGHSCDIYRKTVFRRGGNPYQLWFATPEFVRDPAVPRRAWGTVFETAFLRILRVPKRAKP